MVNKKDPRGMSVQTFPILHPHRILSFLFNVAKIQVDFDQVHEYWDHSRAFQEPWSLAHPATRDHIPLGIHGDSARLWTVHQFEKQMAISMNLPLHRPRSTRHSRFVVFTMPTALEFKNRSLNAVWKRLTWSVNAAFTGFNPTEGVGGKALSGDDLKRSGLPITEQGYCFAVCEIRGDWEFHRDCWRPTCSWQSSKPGKSMCLFCNAVARGDPRFLYHNNGDTCAWDSEEFGVEQFVAQRLKDNNLCGSILVYLELVFSYGNFYTTPTLPEYCF